MKILLEGKRIFKEETNAETKYLIFPKEKIQKYVYNSASIFIKKGDFPFPQKWGVADNFSTRELLTPINEFDSSIYEYMFITDWPLTKQLQEILDPYNIQASDDPNNPWDLNGLLRQEIIPENAQEEIKAAIAKEDLRTYEEFSVYECYSYTDGEIEEFFIINEDSDYALTLSNIISEETDYFFDIYIVETYQKETDMRIEYVFKTDEDEWFKFYSGDANDNYWILKEIYEDELEEFPLSSYTLIETEKRDIPVRKPKQDIWSFLNEDTPYDFYYSDKMFAMQILQEGGRFNLANINGKWERYTEMVLKGEEPFIKWDDLKYIGNGTRGEIKETQLTREEMMLLAVEMREKNK